MTKTQLRAWAGQELDRVTAKVGEIDDISSERYGTALNNISQLQWLAYPGVPWDGNPTGDIGDTEGHTDASDQEETASAAEETSPDNNRMTHQAIPYYVAAHLVMHDDAFAYSALYNEWQSQLNDMYQKPQPHRTVVRNAYGDFYNV